MLDVRSIDSDVGLQEVCEDIASIVDNLDAQNELRENYRTKDASNIRNFQDISKSNQPNYIQMQYQSPFEQSNLQQQQNQEYCFRNK